MPKKLLEINNIIHINSWNEFIKILHDYFVYNLCIKGGIYDL